MKKTTTAFLVACAAMSLTACNVAFPIFSITSYPSGSESSSRQQWSSNTSYSQASVEPMQSYSHPQPTPKKEGQTAMALNYGDLFKNNVYDLSAAPSSGNVNLLVIPIWFADSSDYIAPTQMEVIREDIRRSYFGTEEETGWHSVRTYYENESLGRLSLDGTVSEWYQANQRSSAFYSEDAGATATENLTSEAVDWYFNTHEGANRKDFDSDGDGYLDGVMFIYGSPDYNQLGRSSASNMWAYCYWLQDARKQNVVSPGLNAYFWASYDFMYSPLAARARTLVSSYGGGDTSHCKIDAHTYIHEMGHVFGLEDYYDYGVNQYKPAAGFSMQDANRGGHDPYSAIALGWADPYIPTESGTVTIGAFQKEHDVILLTPSWNENDSPFDEYLLLELYTPTNLNAFDCAYAYDGVNKLKGPNATGIRVWHVDARLVECKEIRGNNPIYHASDIGTSVAKSQGSYGFTHAFSNSYADLSYGSVLGNSYDDYDIIHLIRDNGAERLRTTDTLSGNDLFYAGSSFTMSFYYRQFAQGTKLNSGAALGWSFSVTSITGQGNDAQATISLTRA